MSGVVKLGEPDDVFTRRFGATIVVSGFVKFTLVPFASAAGWAIINNSEEFNSVVNGYVTRLGVCVMHRALTSEP